MQQPIFQIKDLTVKVKNKNVLAIGNFEIHRGIIYSVTGQTGAGKSTLLEVLAGIRRPDSGTIIFDGTDNSSPEYSGKLRDEIRFLPQGSRRVWGTVSKYLKKRITIASWSTDSVDDRIKNITKHMSLSDRMNRLVRTLSPGERRWIDLAICMASDSKVLIIDELEQHMSYDELDFLKRQLQRKCNYEGTTVILSTLNPMSIRRLTGVSVTLDRGHIAMIRSVRDGGRSRRGGEGRGDSKSSGDRPNKRRPSSTRGGRGRSSRAPKPNSKD
ncbi:MAG: ATP-binding cassette domain-containing protein [Candidatus Neomarinimicrobiota bacterium]